MNAWTWHNWVRKGRRRWNECCYLGSVTVYAKMNLIGHITRPLCAVLNNYSICQMSYKTETWNVNPQCFQQLPVSFFVSSRDGRRWSAIMDTVLSELLRECGRHNVRKFNDNAGKWALFLHFVVKRRSCWRRKIDDWVPAPAYITFRASLLVWYKAKEECGRGYQPWFGITIEKGRLFKEKCLYLSICREGGLLRKLVR